MAIPVVEFSRKGYTIRGFLGLGLKICSQRESKVPKYDFQVNILRKKIIGIFLSFFSLNTL